MSDEISLGDVVQDEITGFSGVAVARTSYLHRCSQVCIEPMTTDDHGRRFDGEWFDEPRVKRMDERAIGFADQESR